MYKKILATMAMIFAVTLLGCGNASTETKTEAPAKQEEATVAEPTAEPVVEAAVEDTEETAETSEEEAPDNRTFIVISWDEASVEYTGDPYEYQVDDGIVAPQIYIEGDSVRTTSVSDEGTIHTEIIEVGDPDTYVSIIVEPTAPTNDCPLDTVTATITHPDGKEETLTPETNLVRGQTGIWYFDVYEQGSDQ